MADNSQDFQPSGGTTPPSAGLLVRTDVQLKDTSPAPSSSAARLDASSPATDAGPVSTTATEVLAPPLILRGSTSPSDTEVATTATEVLVPPLILRGSTSPSDSEVATTATVTEVVAPPLIGTCSTHTPEESSSSIDESPVWNYAENRIFLTERLGEQDRRGLLNDEYVGHGDVSQAVTEQDEDAPVNRTGDRFHQNEPISNSADGTNSDTNDKKPRQCESTLCQNGEAESEVEKADEAISRKIHSELSDVDDAEEKEFTSSSRTAARQFNTEVNYYRPSVSGRTTAGYQDTDVNDGLIKHEHNPTVCNGTNFSFDAASSHTEYSATAKDAVDDYSEHEETIYFNLTIFLQHERPSKQLEKKQSNTSEESTEPVTNMEATSSAHALESQASIEDSSNERQKSQNSEQQSTAAEPCDTEENGTGTNPDSGSEREINKSENSDETKKPSWQQHQDSVPARPESRGSKSSMEPPRRGDSHDAENAGDISQNPETDAVSQSNGGQSEEEATEQGSSPTEEAEYGSPSKPKPPMVPFQKPSPQRMAELDRHVLMTPKQLIKFPAFDLAQYLTSSTRTEMETAYVIFRWVTCQFPRQGPTTPRAEGQEMEAEEEEKKKGEVGEGAETTVPILGTYVKQLQIGRLDHADLFSILCKCVNLETHKAEGRLRYYSPQPSPQLVRTRPSSWSALLLPGGWGLVDCALGARYWASEAARRASIHRARAHPPRTGHVPNGDSKEVLANGVSPGGGGLDSRQRSRSGERVESAVFRAYEEFSSQNFYFLPPPRLLVTSHLPDNPCWQLLPHPVAETDFLTSLLLKPHLHYLGVDLLSPSSLRLTEISEEMDVTWKLKGEGLRRFAFRFFSLGDGESSHQELSRHGFLENQHSREAVSLRLIPPASGRHVCELYGTYVPTRGNEMIHMCSFDLDFVKTTSTPLKFPHNDRVEWGPGAECMALGLSPVSHVTGCVNVDRGETELVFRFSSPVLLTQKLFSAADHGQGTEVPRSTINFRDSKNRIKILMRIPDPGDYVLSLYAKEESSSGKCQLVCNYLVLCDSGTPEVVHPFPSLPFNKLGPTKAFFDLGMKLVCPKRSCIVVAPYSGKVTFVFGSPEDTELSCDLLHQGSGWEELTDSGDYVQHTYQSGESVFRARLPLAGDYIFHLYGKPSDGEGHKFLLYSALIECAVPNKDCLPLPRVVTEWRSRVQILAPLRKCLVLGAVTHFAVRAYKVKAVAIVSQSGVQNFVNEDEEEDEGKDEIGDDNAGTVGNADTQEENTKLHTENTDEQDQKYHIQEPDNTVNGSTKTQTTQNKETSHENELGVMNGNHEMDARNTTSPHHDSAPDHSNQNGLPHSRDASATKKVTMRQEEEEVDDDDEREEEWQVWRCKVKVDREDEGSGVKLCVQASSSTDCHMICVAEFEVITERNMVAKLDHQHSLWAAAEENFKVRPDSGHRSDIDDEERQSAYFLDDEVYLSNPLGDDNSDSDDSDNFSQDDDEESADDVSSDDETDSDFEETTSGSSVAKQGHKAEIQDSSSKSPRRNVAGDRALDKGDPKKTTVPPQKAKKGPAIKTFHASAVYNAPQPSGIRETRQRAALKQKEKMGYSSNVRSRGEKAKLPAQEQKKKEAAKEKSVPPESTTSGEKSELAGTSHSNKKGKNADGSRTRQDSGTRERTLRRKLWKACQRREREAIKKAVRNYTRRDYPPCPDLAAAERLLHLFKLQDALIEALASEDQQTIRLALTEVERHGFAGEMSVECRKAHAILSPHRNYGRLPDLQVETDMRTLMEIRSYRCPPRVVHHVIVATLLLLGVHEGLTKTWKRCRKRLQVLGRKGILKKMVKLQVDAVHPEISARARLLMDKHSTEEALNAGPGVLAVYKWAKNVLSRVENLTELEEAYSGDAPPQPASKRRQKEIFRQVTTTTTTTSKSSTTTTKPQGSEMQKTKGGKQAGPETPRNKSNNKPSKDLDRNPSTVRKEPGSQAGKEVTARTPGKQNTQADPKRSLQSRDTGKPSSGIIPKANPALNTNSNNVLKSNPAQDNTPKHTRKIPDDPQTQSPGYQPRPKPPLQNARRENSEKGNVILNNRTPHASHRMSTTPKSSPDRTANHGTTPNKQLEDARRPQPTPKPSTVRYDQPQDQLRCLSPRKSPLFRPANKPKTRSDPVRSRPHHRPKTTPTPVLQSTFFFASLVGKEEGEDEEVNNNIPLTFTNYSNGAGGIRTAKTAGSNHHRAGGLTETRLGERGEHQHHSAIGRRSISDITTPDI